MLKKVGQYLAIPFLIAIAYLAWWYHTWLLNKRVDSVIKATRQEIERLIEEHKKELERVSQEHKAELAASYAKRIKDYEDSLKVIEEERSKFTGVSRERLAGYINEIKAPR